ncbi:MAG TPA: MASE1 domain-containing protein, partial [Nevskiaceae bacterium]|nr:MASE1 domain-containing protein [Nevskiaceae bacterium]
MRASLSDEQVVTGARFAILLALLVAVYFAAGKFGLGFAVVHRSASAIWPPTGVAIAALLILGLRAWPAILLGAFLVNVSVDGRFVTAACIAVGNTLEGVVAAGLVMRSASGVRCFERPRDIFRFMALAALCATLISPTWGVTTLAVAGAADWSAFGRIWLTWWLGDAVGAVIVTPLIVLWYRQLRLDLPASRLLEACGMLALVAAVSVFVFFRPTPLLSFMVLPALAWAAFRFGQREVATAMGLLALIAIFGTVQGRGPFAIVDASASLLALQAFLGTIAVMMLAIAAFVGERREAMQDAQSANRAKDQFIAMLSHELRNPLQAIGSSAGLLGQPSLPDHVLRQSVDIIQRQTDNLTRLVNDLLDVTRVVEGKSSLFLQPVDLAETVRRSMATLASSGRTDRHRIEICIEPAWVQGDAVRLDQVVVNLLTNAIKYTP